MESGTSAHPNDAHDALRDLADARERLAERVSAPWWYRVGAAACTAALFLGIGLVLGRPETGRLTETASTLIVVVGAVLGPIALLRALRRSTGVSVERYAAGMGAWYVTVFALFALGVGLQAFAGVPWALPVAGAGAFVATLLTERHIDGLLRQRVRRGAVGPAGA